MPPDQAAGGALSDDSWLRIWRAAAWRRWRAWAACHAAVMGAIAALLAWTALRATVIAPPRWTVGLTAIIVAVLAWWLTPGTRDVRAVVARAEEHTPDLRNALIAWHEAVVPSNPAIWERLAMQARRALEPAPWPHPFTVRRWLMAGAALATAAVLVLTVPGTDTSVVPVATTREDAARVAARRVGPLDWHVVVTPPTYARRHVIALETPARVEALAGSTARVTFTGWPTGASLRFGMAGVAPEVRAGTAVATFALSSTDVLFARDATGSILAAVTFLVAPDSAPAVRISTPGTDVRRAEAAGTILIRTSAEDDLGLRDLRLRYTKVSGSGESFEFVDGEWPLVVRRASATAWDGTLTLDLVTLGLSRGDVVVYHAVAHDARPGREGMAESERFLIEIPRHGGVAGGDFSLPDPEHRYALSQRMLIQLTERLHERRARLAPDAYRQEAQDLAVQQRRVRAEFVFMMGGEVVDEVEEAEHSHEVEAGRLQNRGQSELTEAVRQMSQAEKRLTDAALPEALVHEYRALHALQAAFGRSRYFMRTLPITVQIDPSRRLIGDRTLAAAARWQRRPLRDAQRARGLALVRRLDTLAAGDAAGAAAMVADLLALDRQTPEWVHLVQGLAAGAAPMARSGATERVRATEEVTRALRARLLGRVPAWLTVPLARGEAETGLARAAAPGERP